MGCLVFKTSEGLIKSLVGSTPTSSANYRVSFILGWLLAHSVKIINKDEAHEMLEIFVNPGGVTCSGS